jgi:hypothetical protein
VRERIAELEALERAMAAGLEIDEDDEEPLPEPDDELGTHVSLSLSGVQSVERSLTSHEPPLTFPRRNRAGRRRAVLAPPSRPPLPGEDDSRVLRIPPGNLPRLPLPHPFALQTLSSRRCPLAGQRQRHRLLRQLLHGVLGSLGQSQEV